MKVSLFKPFFSLTQPDFGSQVIYGSSHFFHRLRTYGSWLTYNEIIPRQKEHGALIIGQIPIERFRDDLLNKLCSDALVVSCNEGFELAGVGTPYHVIPSYSWWYYNIAHHHLPFTDFSANADLGLVIYTLEKMKTVHEAGGTIYLHCKAGRGRSGLLAVLFFCLKDSIQLKQQLLQGIKPEVILDNAINLLKNTHPQLKIGSMKKLLGIKVLSYYANYWNMNASDGVSDEFELFHHDNEVSSPCNYLQSISQSQEYKFICDQAYKNPDIFQVIQKFLCAVYTNAEEREMMGKPIFNIELGLRAVLKTMNASEKQILLSLHAFYTEKESFINDLRPYSTVIQGLGFDLCNKIISSSASHEQKSEWLKRTRECLNKPSKTTIEKYLAAANNALNTGNLALKTIGLMMLLVGIAFIMITIAAACAATGGILGASLVMIAGISFGGLGAGLGKTLYDLGKSDGVTAASKNFISHCQNQSEDSNTDADKTDLSAVDIEPHVIPL